VFILVKHNVTPQSLYRSFAVMAPSYMVGTTLNTLETRNVLRTNVNLGVMVIQLDLL